jgi:hypothetical protein
MSPEYADGVRQVVTKNPLVPRGLLVEALMGKLEALEHPERANADPPPGAPVRLMKRIPQVRFTSGSAGAAALLDGEIRVA